MSKRTAQEVQNEISKAEAEISGLMDELGAIYDENPASARMLYLNGCGFSYITEDRKRWGAEYGYEVGQWMPSAGTC